MLHSAKRFCYHDMLLGASLFGLLGASVCAKSLSVKLRDATYVGYHNATSGLDVWLGIRYAAPPVGDLRWRAAQPVGAGKGVVNATTMPMQCVQSVVSLVAGCTFALNLIVHRPSGMRRLPVKTVCS